MEEMIQLFSRLSSLSQNRLEEVMLNLSCFWEDFQASQGERKGWKESKLYTFLQPLFNSQNSLTTICLWKDEATTSNSLPLLLVILREVYSFPNLKTIEVKAPTMVSLCASGREVGRSKCYLLQNSRTAAQLLRVYHTYASFHHFMNLVRMFLEVGLTDFFLSEPEEWGQIEMGTNPEVLDELSNSRFTLEYLALRFLKESNGPRVWDFSTSCPNLESLQLYLRRVDNDAAAEPLSLSEGSTLTGELKILG